MSGKEIIDLLISKWLSFGQTITVDNAAFRDLCRHYVQKRTTRMWFLHDWDFAYNEFDTVVTAQASVDDPNAGLISTAPDFHALTKSGLIYPTTKNLPPLVWKPKLQFMAYARRGSTTTQRSNPQFYSEVLQNTDGFGNLTGGRRFIGWPFPTVDFDVRMYYKTKPPTIIDLDDFDQVTSVSFARASDVTTVTTDADHGLVPGQFVLINGAADTSFNGTFTVLNPVPDSTSFTVTNAGPDVAVTPDTHAAVIPEQSNLNAIPEEYHETILVEGAISELMDKEGDGRSAVYEGKYLKGIAEAWQDETQGQNTPRKWGRRYGARFRRRMGYGRSI